MPVTRCVCHDVTFGELKSIAAEVGPALDANSPIDNYLPGRERPVANHFGVFVNP